MQHQQLTQAAVQAQPFIQMQGIWKEFPGVVASRGIDIDFQRGEVHALLGENGAGKTTLMNILSGLYDPSEGRIYIDGQEVQFDSPSAAIARGVGMVHQTFKLVDKLTAAENIFLGWDKTPWHCTTSSLNNQAMVFARQFGYAIQPDARIWQLSVGEQQKIEILRMLARGASLLILDEPTAVLTPNEAQDLFRVLRDLASNGKAVVFISHKLAEVLEVSDRITVLRGGKKIATRDTRDCNHMTLARLMIGESAMDRTRNRQGDQGNTLLALRKVCARGARGLPSLIDLDLEIREREILGIAGVAGNGQSELAEVLTGLRPVQSGSIVLDGVELSGQGPRAFARAGVGHIPEDRAGVGLVESRTITHNAILRKYADPPIRRGLQIDEQQATDYSAQLVKRFDVRTTNLRALVRVLSGGNQQRLLAGREIQIASRLLIAVHPTRGLDIAATEEVRDFLVAHRNQGNAVLLISEDLDELLAISDRIGVMYSGRLAGVFSALEVEREAIGLAMGGMSLGKDNG